MIEVWKISFVQHTQRWFILMELTQEIVKQFRTALYNQIGGYDDLMVQFKKDFPLEYKKITTTQRRRSDIKTTIEAMKYLHEDIYWFTLTFNEVKDKNSVLSKRKEAMQYLNRIAGYYLLVEEYGSENGRYHIHGFLVFRFGKGFKDFRDWHSRQNIVLLGTDKKVSKRVYYLTNYMSKDVPRIRRSKSLVALVNVYKKNKRLLRNDFTTTANNNIGAYIESSLDMF